MVSPFDSKKHNSFKRLTHDRNWGVVLSQLSINHNLYLGAEERREDQSSQQRKGPVCVLAHSKVFRHNRRQSYL